MKKNRLKLKNLLIAIIIASSLTSCATYTIHDNRIRIHHIKQGEPAPFDGLLLNQYTYNKIKERLKECKLYVSGKR